MNSHEIFMRRCFQLASLGAGRVAPNPMVGAVLVYENRIIGEGYHQAFGSGHAEVNCLQSVSPENKELIPLSTLYVSLEPCNHFGKTPPCTDLIIENTIPRVVLGCRDLHEKVNGSGIARLKDAGVEVIEGICEKEALFINRRFFTFHSRKRPYIILKWAQSADGFLGKTDERTSISNPISSRLVHKWRSEEAAIMVGTRTAQIDNPSLTTRLWPGLHPVRIVIDLAGKLSPSLNLFDQEARTIVISGMMESESGHIQYRRVDPEIDLIDQIVRILYEENIQSVLVEGGGRLLQSFIEAGIWDEARVIVSSRLLLSAGVKAPELSSARKIREDRIRQDVISSFEHI